MLRRLLGKVDDKGFGRALAGLQSDWQWECAARHAERVEDTVLYSGKHWWLLNDGALATQ
ncbi:MAG: hypothetical protein WCY82_10360 [Desulfotomaculaceae bacterium]